MILNYRNQMIKLILKIQKIIFNLLDICINSIYRFLFLIFLYQFERNRSLD
jgi:hypothetical protein